MLLAIVNATESVQNCSKIAKICQNLPKDKTLKYHQKSRF
jgi:hypothetical protein